MATKIFYPHATGADPHTSFDGYVSRFVASESWGTLHDNVDGTAATGALLVNYIRIVADNLANKWRGIWRSLLLFDTSELIGIVTVAVLKVFFVQWTYSPYDGTWSPAINVYSSNPASDLQPALADYPNFGTTPFCDTPITRTHITTLSSEEDNQYQTFELNAAGIAAINISGITKFGLRDANYDAPDSAPSWIANTNINLIVGAVEGIESVRPYLEVTYNPTARSIAQIIS